MSLPNNQPNDPPLCDYEGSTYRTDFWEGRGRDYEDGAERLALSALVPSEGRRLLDLGAGFGRLADLYAGYDEVVLVDYSQSQLEYARQHWGDERFIYVAADLYHLPLVNDAVDTLVMVRVLHHIADVPAALTQIARVIRPQGTLVLEFANKRHLKNVLRYLGRRGINPFTHQPYEFATLHFDFHPAWIDALLAEAGLEPLQRRSVSLFRSGWFKRHFPMAFLMKLESLLQRPTAALALGPSQFVQARAAKSGAAPAVAHTQIFRCPACEGWPLEPGANGLFCPTCGARWPIENGIYIFKRAERS